MKERLSSQSSVERNSASHSKSRAESDSESGSSSSSEFEHLQQTPKKTQIQSTINSYNNNGANLMQTFSAENPDLKKIEISNYISDSDDICLVEIPASIDPNLLLNKNINFEGKSKLKLGKSKYIVEPRTESAENLLILDGKLNYTRPVSSLVLRKKLKDQAKGNIDQPEQTSVPFPENLKVRHPLFGPEYEKSLVLNEEIKQKLNGTFEYSSNSIKNKSKKKKKHKEKVVVKEELKSDNEDVEQEDLIQNLFQDIDKKSKKKKAPIAETPIRNKIKHENSFVNSTIIPNLKLPTFDLDISNITQDGNTKKIVNGESSAKKKSKKVKEEPSKKRKLSSSKEESNEIATPKKKKKAKDAETDNLIKDILNSVRKKITKKS